MWQYTVTIWHMALESFRSSVINELEEFPGSLAIKDPALSLHAAGMAKKNNNNKKKAKKSLPKVSVSASTFSSFLSLHRDLTS